ncbi:MAG: hypothetical protein ACLUYK_01370 [Eggerthella lenta]
MQQGLMMRTPKGRQATAGAWGIWDSPAGRVLRAVCSSKII